MRDRDRSRERLIERGQTERQKDRETVGQTKRDTVVQVNRGTIDW